LQASGLPAYRRVKRRVIISIDKTHIRALIQTTVTRLPPAMASHPPPNQSCQHQIVPLFAILPDRAGLVRV